MWSLSLALVVACTDQGAGGGVDTSVSDDTAVPVLDADGDGHAAAPDGDDCDDGNDGIYPGAAETCGDGVDQDCDGYEVGCSGSMLSTQGAGYLKGEDDEQGYGLGRSMDVAWDWSEDGSPTIVVGAPWRDDDPKAVWGGNTGAVYGLSPGDLAEGQGIEGRATWELMEEERESVFGWEIQVDDVDGDSVSDLVVGTPQTGLHEDRRGVVWLFSGPLRADQLPSLDDGIRIDGNHVNQQIGSDVEAGVDVSGDELPDIVVSRAAYCRKGERGGAVVLLGDQFTSHVVDEGDPAYDVESECWGGAYETAVSDLDGDGIGDLALGAYLGGTTWVDPKDGTYTIDTVGPGLVYVQLGPLTAGGDLADAQGRLEGPSSRSDFGLTVESMADIDGDGLPELLAAAPGAGDVLSGRAWIIPGGQVAYRGSVEDVASVTIDGDDDPYLFLGKSMADGGDIDGDGQRDLLVGAVVDGNGGTQGGRGQISVFRGPLAGTLTPADAVLTVLGRNGDDQFGFFIADSTDGGSLRGAVDINGDGADDWLVGADLCNDQCRGALYLFYGGMWD